MRDAADINKIRKTIPHSFPFMMLDRVIDLVPGKSAKAVKKIPAASPFTPHSPMYPQVFLIEGMAQLAAVAAAPASSAASDDRAAKPESGFLAAITDARFHKRPVSGDEIKYSVEFEAAAMGLARFRGKAEIDGELAAEGLLTFSVPGGVAR